MPELSGATLRRRAAGISSIAPGLEEVLDRPYRYQGDEAEAIASPREIVTRLHEQIAAMSPAHAALVAEYERIRDEPPQPLPCGRPTSRQQRVAHYADLREDGHTKRQAAAKLGISLSTAGAYEAECRRALLREAS